MKKETYILKFIGTCNELVFNSIKELKEFLLKDGCTGRIFCKLGSLTWFRPLTVTKDSFTYELYLD